MVEVNIDGIKITYDDAMSIEEVEQYVSQFLNQKKILKPGDIESMSYEISSDNPEEVIRKYTLAPKGFERIRRITGYLVGTIDKFNNAKRKEVEDRVKHTYVFNDEGADEQDESDKTR